MLLSRYFKNLAFYKRTIVSSRYPDTTFKKETIAENYFRYCEKYSERIAFVDYIKNISYTYSDFQNSIKSIASSLTKRGFQKGTTVGIIASNCPEHIMLQVALSSIGCPVMLCNINYTKDEIITQIKDSQTTILFSTDDVLQKVSEAASDLSFIKDIYLIGKRKEGFQAVEELLNDSGNMNPIGHQNLDVDDQVAIIIYSSGTTGPAKGVMLTHTNLNYSFHQLTHGHKLEDGRTFVMALPLYHGYSTCIITPTSIMSGSKSIILPKFDPTDFLTAIEKYKVNTLHLVPPQISFLLNHPEVSKHDLSCVLKSFCAGSPLDQNMENLFLDKFRVHQPHFNNYKMYGLTECSAVTHIMPHCERHLEKRSSVGMLVPNVKCKIVDVSTRDEVFANNTGEILMKGPTLMKGYIGKPGETNCMFENGWLKTGDIGYYDSDNYFYVSDRLIDLIKVKGLHVSPTELEGVLLTMSGIVDCAVTGVRDERYGEVPKAFVVRNNDINEKEINDYMAKHLSGDKQLKGGIHFVKEIPKTPSGKIIRRLLKNN